MHGHEVVVLFFRGKNCTFFSTQDVPVDSRSLNYSKSLTKESKSSNQSCLFVKLLIYRRKRLDSLEFSFER